MKIAVLGSGNAGITFAAYLARNENVDVFLCDLVEDRISDLSAKKKIILHIEHKDDSKNETYSVPIKCASADIGEVVKDAELIMVATAASSHKKYAAACAPFITENQTIVLNPGRTFGALEFRNELRKRGCSAYQKVTIAEAQTLVFACRKQSDCETTIKGKKDVVNLSAETRHKAEEVVAMLKPFNLNFAPVESYMYTSLDNIGSIFHPGPTLLNYGAISRKDKFEYYMDGITPDVASFLEDLDAERIAVAHRYYIDIAPAKKWLFDSYKAEGDSLYSAIQNNTAYKGITAPSKVNVRYVTEDVPTGLVPIADLGKALRVETPCMNALIDLANVLYKKDFRKEGRTLENLGIIIHPKEYGDINIVGYWLDEAFKGHFREE